MLRGGPQEETSLRGLEAQHQLLGLGHVLWAQAGGEVVRAVEEYRWGFCEDGNICHVDFKLVYVAEDKFYIKSIEMLIVYLKKSGNILNESGAVCTTGVIVVAKNVLWKDLSQTTLQR